MSSWTLWSLEIEILLFPLQSHLLHFAIVLIIAGISSQTLCKRQFA
jgi:hypothetical protein